METLLWAMKCLQDLSFSNVSFVTDCHDLLLITENQDWPSFDAEVADFTAFKSYFSFFSLMFFSRSFNVRADLPAKKVRTRGSLFAHVSSNSLIGSHQRKTAS